jgi:hypothetical protein
MAEQILKNVKLFLDGYNLSGDMNSCTVSKSVELVDDTVFGSTFRSRRAGLGDFTVNVGGFWNSSDYPAPAGGGKVDPIVWNKIGSSNDVLSVLPNGTDRKSQAIFAKGIESEYSPSGEIGGMFGYNFTAYGNHMPVRGKVLFDGWLTTKAKSSGVSIGTIAAAQSSGKKLEVGVHVLNCSSTGAVSLSLVVLRATSTNFGADSTRYTFALSTGTVGKAVYGSSVAHGSSGQFSYRINLKRAAGSSQNRLKALVVIGHGT